MLMFLEINLVVFKFGSIKKSHRKYQKILFALHYSEASGGWEQNTNLSKKATLKLVNTTLLIAPTAVTSTIMKPES